MSTNQTKPTQKPMKAYCHVIQQAASGIAAYYAGESWKCKDTEFEEEVQANANLIEEAFNVHAETGLTPRQLAKQREVLERALIKIAAFAVGEGDIGNVVAKHARAALAKAEKGE